MTEIVILAFGLAALPALLYRQNVRLFQPPSHSVDRTWLHRVSVLIPARNEAATISATLTALLETQGVEFEVVVLDDHSEDGTADTVRKFAALDSRVRLESAPQLPAGWCGKQHACYVLSKLAMNDVLLFLDADVRLAPDALLRMSGFLHSSKAGLVSGFPRQECGTITEKLVLPLINWLLMCYLPIARMRQSMQPGLGTGCGQLFVTTREAYAKAGGHAAVRSSLHDGVTLPRAYRRSRQMTDVCDATELATCRMYRSASELWYGLAKNAHEGLGAWPIILLWTFLLFGGHVLPIVLLVAAPVLETWQLVIVLGAVILSVAPRLDAARRFRASWLGAAMHPLGVTILLSIQWYATLRAICGMPVGWKGRPRPVPSNQNDGG